jgi:hypothetical protein
MLEDLMTMFTVEERERVREWLIEQARADGQIAGAAAVGSSASGGDRWSDVDLTFGVAPGATVKEVLDRWTEIMRERFAAEVLFDIAVQATVYRVFLLPGALQVDLSFSPADQFGARTPRFALIFGEAVPHPAPVAAPDAGELFGIGVHHAVRAHICIERGLLWQAEYWIHNTRDQALALACLRLGLDTRYARGFDLLPEAVRAPFLEALPRALDVTELRRALAAAATGLLREAEPLVACAARVRPMLAPMVSPVGSD